MADDETAANSAAGDEPLAARRLGTVMAVAPLLVTRPPPSGSLLTKGVKAAPSGPLSKSA